MKSLALFASSLLSLAFALAACSAEPAASGTKAAETANDVDASVPDDTDPPPSKCGELTTKGKCKNEGAIVRGLAKFDPARFASGSKPTLRVVLRHSFIVGKGEELVGGRLHAWKSFEIADPSKGEIAFSIDMCDEGISMWSEENGPFNVILMLDVNGNNDLDKATGTTSAMKAATPDENELVKMVPLEISCKAPSPCLEVSIDCTGGTACTTITPVDSCKKKTPGCSSDSEFCR